MDLIDKFLFWNNKIHSLFENIFYYFKFRRTFLVYKKGVFTIFPPIV